MPLLDHFRPPLSERRHWDSFHGAWAEAMATTLNESLLPERFVAEARVHLGGQVEIDVAAFAERETSGQHLEENSIGAGGVAVWSPPKPMAAPLDFSDPDVFEVQIINGVAGPQLEAAIQLVSPANKDRPANRRMFAVKCASYLNSGVSVIIVDVVTQRSGKLQAELLDILNAKVATSARGLHDLYATVHRTANDGERLHLETWAHELGFGRPLPTLPLWLSSELCLPLDLEATYRAACAARRI